MIDFGQAGHGKDYEPRSLEQIKAEYAAQKK